MTLRYVALGDSTSEGIGDEPLPDGTPRGWADRLATILAGSGERVLYANLAIRGQKSRHVLETQLEAALALAPDLVTISAGTNDLLRSDFTAEALRETLTELVGPLLEAGARVVVVPAPPIAHLMPLGRWADVVAERITAMNDVLADLAATQGITVRSTLTTDAFADPRLWAPDRLHLNAHGHDRLARGVAVALGHVDDPDWRDQLLGAVVGRTWLRDAGWWIGFAVPWVGRRLRGRKSGDGITAKLPTPVAVA